jgi:hypothetical protein
VALDFSLRLRCGIRRGEQKARNFEILMELKVVTIEVNPKLTADELFDFYERNDICETGFGKEKAAKILRHPHLMVAAFHDRELVGLARAVDDGLAAHIMEFSVDLRFQGEGGKHKNGSLIESDRSGLGRLLGRRLLDELYAKGATFITGYIVAGCEEEFYRSLGFRENAGHLVYHIDKRAYVES